MLIAFLETPTPFKTLRPSSSPHPVGTFRHSPHSGFRKKKQIVPFPFPSPPPQKKRENSVKTPKTPSLADSLLRKKKGSQTYACAAPPPPPLPQNSSSPRLSLCQSSYGLGRDGHVLFAHLTLAFSFLYISFLLLFSFFRTTSCSDSYYYSPYYYSLRWSPAGNIDATTRKATPHKCKQKKSKVTQKKGNIIATPT